MVLTLLALWLVWNGFHTVQRTIYYYTALPMWDYWRVVQNLEGYQALDLSVFWRQHNEHRIIFPEIVFALDMLLLHGRMMLPLILSSLCYAGTWLALSSTLFAEEAMTSSMREGAILLAGIVGLWEGAANVLAAPFLLQWTIMQLAVAITFISLGELRLTSSTRYLITTIAAAVVATYSSGSALLLWPLVLFVALCIRLRKRDVISLAVAAVVTLGVYFIGYQFTSQLKLRNFIDYPLYSIEYVASYLSMPFGAIRTPIFGVKVGLFGCAMVVAAFAIAAATKRVITRPGIALFGYWAFTLLTAVLTAGGRMDPNDPKFIAAQAFRYLTVPQMNWAVIVLLLFWAPSGITGAKRLLPVLAVLISYTLVIYFPKLSPWLNGVANFFTEQQLAALTVEDGLHNRQWIEGKVFPDIHFYDAAVPKLQKQHLSIYYHGRQGFLGKPLQTLAPGSPEKVQGAIVQAIPVESGYELEGWADVSSWRRPYVWLAFADNSGKIVGFGRRFPAGIPTSETSPLVPSSLAWIGFIPSHLRPSQISAYVLAPRGNALFALGQPFELPALEVGGAEMAGARLEGAEFQSGPASTAQSLPMQPNFGKAPDGPVVSTWNGSDTNVGTIRTSSFPAPANSCLVAPLLHGPSVDGLSVSVKNSETGATIYSFPLRAVNQQWQYWRISLKPSEKKVFIEADDSGKDWGQWLAVSAPRSCK